MSAAAVTDEQRVSAAYSLMAGDRTPRVKALQRRRVWLTAVWSVPLLIAIVAVGIVGVSAAVRSGPREPVPGWRLVVGYGLVLVGLGLVLLLRRRAAAPYRPRLMPITGVLTAAQRARIRELMASRQSDPTLDPLVRHQAQFLATLARGSLSTVGVAVLWAGMTLTFRTPLYVGAFVLGPWVLLMCVQVVVTQRRARAARGYLLSQPDTGVSADRGAGR